jgi:hypothetical protein
MPRAGFAYVDGALPTSNIPTVRLRYAGFAGGWGFAIYRASNDDYEDSYLLTGSMAPPPKTPSIHLHPLPRRPNRLELKPRRTYGCDH